MASEYPVHVSIISRVVHGLFSSLHLPLDCELPGSEDSLLKYVFKLIFRERGREREKDKHRCESRILIGLLKQTARNGEECECMFQATMTRTPVIAVPGPETPTD